MKHITMIFGALFVSVLCLTTGCSTLSDARVEKGKGVAYVYEASFDKVWNLVPQAVISLGPFPPRILENNVQEGYIFTQGNSRMARNVSFGISGTLVGGSYGQNALIFVEKIDENRTKVEVISDRALTTAVLAANWPPRIHRKLSETLRRVQ